MKKVILMFDGTDNDYLSNFYPAPIEIDGKKYWTSEAYYQAMKASTEKEHDEIQSMSDPSDAKAAGRKVQLREGWNDFKYLVMLRAVRAKFQQHPELAERLINTGDTLLVEGTYWHDETWGIYRWNGMNLLGRILMRVRDELYASVSTEFTGDNKTMYRLIAEGLTKAMKEGTMPSEDYITRAFFELDTLRYLETKVDLSPRSS